MTIDHRQRSLRSAIIALAKLTDRATRGATAALAAATALAALLPAATAFAAPPDKPKRHVSWTARLSPDDARAGESAQIVLTATLDPEWHVYSLTTPDGGPLKTVITLKPGGALKPDGKPSQPAPLRKRDDAFGVDVESFTGAVAFGIPVRIEKSAAGASSADVTTRFQLCDAHVCLPPETLELPVSFTVAPGAARPERTLSITSAPAQPASYQPPGKAAPAGPTIANPGAPKDDVQKGLDDARGRGLLSYLWISIVAGLATLFTPCVFPMIPITVSFFTKQKNEGGHSSLAGPIAYCLGIISTFTGLGLAVTLLFGATGVQKIAANPWVNIALAVIFVSLAAALFGVFEITLPSSWLNRAHAGTRRAGIVGPLLMGFTFTLTSFTCTVPVVGTLLASAAKGDLLYPVAGMLAFSTAFALPFFLLALFPQWLAKLPRSGAWLVSVKAVMGFLELAAALKFISNVDLVWQLGWITRPIFLAVWAGIFAICGLYLLGWIRLPHDPGGRIGYFRRGLALATVAGSFYFLAAMNGASLGQLEAFPPPDPYPFRNASSRVAAGAVQWRASFDEALAEAKSANRALFINFTGVT